MKKDELIINLHIIDFSLSRSIDDIVLVWEHLKYIRIGNDEYEREKDTIVESIKYHTGKLEQAKKELRAKISNWCKEE